MPLRLIKGPLPTWVPIKNISKSKREGKIKSVQHRRRNMLPGTLIDIEMRMMRHLTGEACWRLDPDGGVPLSRRQHCHLCSRSLSTDQSMKWWCTIFNKIFNATSNLFTLSCHWEFVSPGPGTRRVRRSDDLGCGPCRPPRGIPATPTSLIIIQGVFSS